MPGPRLLRNLVQLVGTVLPLLDDSRRFRWFCAHARAALAAENLFLQKQLAMYQERRIKPRRATDATRLALVWLGRWFDWRQALAVGQPATFLGWQRKGFRLFWRWKSQSGRPPIPAALQALIHLRRLLNDWILHYNGGRPHMSLGPGMPQPPPSLPVPLQAHRHRLPPHVRVVTRPLLGGLHHEY